jgi:hypothetical protein
VHGTQYEFRTWFGNQEEADLGILKVENSGQLEGLVRGDSWAEDQYFRRCPVELLEHIVGSACQHLRGKGLQLSVERPGDGLTNTPLKIADCGDSYKPAH